MDEILLDSVIDKVDAHDKKIGELHQKIEQTPNYRETFVRTEDAINELRSEVRKISFPENELREFSGRLIVGINLLKQPVEQKVIHHHHFHKIIWISVGLFLVLCLVLTGWYNTYDKLQLYKANDTKYRYLKLEADGGLLKWMKVVDSLYLVDKKMRDNVIDREEQNERDFEMMQKAKQMEEDARELKKKAGNKGNR
jgi:hypothetical protein